MDLRRLRAGEWIAATSGVLLAACLFLPWYTRDAGGVGERDFSAWESFAAVDLILLALAVLAVGLLILTALQPTAAMGIAADALLTIVAACTAILTVIRVLDIPGSLGGDVTRAPFAWVGLAAVLGVLVGTVIAMRDERLSKPGKPTDATGVPVDSAPEIEVLPAPRRGQAEE